MEKGICDKAHCNPEYGTDKDLKGCMTNKLLQVFCVKFDLFGMLAVEIIHDLIDYNGLRSCLAAYTSGVIHNDDGQNGCDCKYSGPEAIFECRCDHKSAYGGGVTAGHSTASDKSFAVDLFVDKKIDNCLYDLSGTPADTGSHQGIIVKKIK